MALKSNFFQENISDSMVPAMKPPENFLYSHSPLWIDVNRLQINYNYERTPIFGSKIDRDKLAGEGIWRAGRFGVIGDPDSFTNEILLDIEPYDPEVLESFYRTSRVSSDQEVLTDRGEGVESWLGGDGKLRQFDDGVLDMMFSKYDTETKFRCSVFPTQQVVDKLCDLVREERLTVLKICVKATHLLTNDQYSTPPDAYYLNVHTVFGTLEAMHWEERPDFVLKTGS